VAPKAEVVYKERWNKTKWRKLRNVRSLKSISLPSFTVSKANKKIPSNRYKEPQMNRISLWNFHKFHLNQKQGNFLTKQNWDTSLDFHTTILLSSS